MRPIPSWATEEYGFVWTCKKCFKAQLRAIFRASAYGNLAIMFPMISSEEEMDEIEAMIEEVTNGLVREEFPIKISEREL